MLRAVLSGRTLAMLLVACSAAAAVAADGRAPGVEPQPLTSTPGDATRGRAIVASRQQGLCLLCHAAPIAEERFQGNLAPDLAGVGSRLTLAQLRARMIDSRRLNPDSIMPAYFRATELTRVGSNWRARALLDAQQVEDVVAYLVTLK